MTKTIDGLSLCEAVAENYRRTLPRGRGGTAWTIESYSHYISLRFPGISVPTNQEWKGSEAKLEHICEEHGSYFARQSHTTTYYAGGSSKCVDCNHNKHKGTCGVITRRSSTPADRAQAKELFDEHQSYKIVGEIMGWNTTTIRQWLHKDYEERHKQRATKFDKDNRDKKRQRDRDYRKTNNGKSSRKSGEVKRQARQLHASGLIFLPDHPNADYQGFVEDDVFSYITPDDYEFWSFDGAEEDVVRRKEQQKKLTHISGETYSLEHLIPLSRGGIHHPMNFVNRALKLNVEKNGKITTPDVELFCKRLFS
tara:strand:- start:265 stop:1194 length:930 start_codon:yes stop_codon:yes gene_type:complete